MRTRLAAFFCLALTACFDTSGGTGGGGGLDTEPNDSENTAEDLGAGGTVGFSGTCEAEDAYDYWKISASAAGAASATVSWDEGMDDDVDIRFYTSDLSLDATDDNEPPGDTPASVSGTVAGPDVVYLEVFCFAGTPAYTGSVTVP